MRLLALVPPLFRYVGEEVIRSRIVFIASALAGIAFVLVALAVQSGDTQEGQGVVLLIGLLIISGPFCRSWLDDDVRLGYGALWLQKPVRPFDLYGARLVGLVGWSSLPTLAIGVFFVLAAAIGGKSLSGACISVASLAWVPAMLIVLNFLGSGLGAKNSGLFAYGMLFAGFALPGFVEAAGLDPLYGFLKALCPPAVTTLRIQSQLRQGEVVAGLIEFRPILTYMAVCAGLGLVTATRVPWRLTRQTE